VSTEPTDRDSDASNTTEATFFKWPQSAVLMLLEQYELSEFEMNSPTVQKHKVWEKIAENN